MEARGALFPSFYLLALRHLDGEVVADLLDMQGFVHACAADSRVQVVPVDPEISFFCAILFVSRLLRSGDSLVSRLAWRPRLLLSAARPLQARLKLEAFLSRRGLLSFFARPLFLPLPDEPRALFAARSGLLRFLRRGLSSGILARAPCVLDRDGLGRILLLRADFLLARALLQERCLAGELVTWRVHGVGHRLLDGLRSQVLGRPDAVLGELADFSVGVRSLFREDIRGALLSFPVRCGGLSWSLGGRGLADPDCLRGRRAPRPALGP